ncbi:MAG: hypothetical protein JXA14_17570 [Anaerolineae bacterium]|nr:hypothetical protein [Anaerolineae bacterium]
MGRTNERRRLAKTRRGRSVRAGLELAQMLADWGASFVDWTRNEGNLRDRLAAWHEVVSGQVVIDDKDE